MIKQTGMPSVWFQNDNSYSGCVCSADGGGAGEISRNFEEIHTKYNLAMVSGAFWSWFKISGKENTGAHAEQRILKAPNWIVCSLWQTPKNKKKEKEKRRAIKIQAHLVPRIVASHFWYTPPTQIAFVFVYCYWLLLLLIGLTSQF